jgi:hypothetical protein
MRSIFDLKTKPSELSSSNQGLSNYKYQEIQSLRSVFGDKFSDSEIVYRWTYGSQKYWIPNKSYLRLRMKLSNPDGSKISATKGVTWAMNTVPLLFQSSTYKIADQTVCQITQNLPQVDTLKNRQKRSDSWLQGIGNDINNWGHTYAQRERNLLTAGGKDASVLNKYKDWGAIITESNLDALDTVAVIIDPSGNGLYNINFTDNAGSDLDLTLLKNVNVGDIIIYESDSLNLGVVTTEKSSGVITEISATQIKFIPDLTAHQVALGAVTADKFKASLYRHDFYDEDDSQLAQSVELIWFPPLSIFDLETAIPCASTKHEFTITSYPETVYQKNCVESRGRSVTNSTDAGDDNFLLTIEDMRFYILTCDSNKIQDNFDFLLDLNEVQCQITPITSTQQQQSLDVVPSTNGLTLCFQDPSTLNDTRYSMSKFKVRDEIERKLVRYYLRYEGQVRNPDWEGVFDRVGTSNITGAKDTMKDLYLRTKVYDGTYFMENPESYETWSSRGLYIFHPFPKTQSSKNTRVYAQVNFSDLLDGSGNAVEPFMLLFSHYKKVVICTVQNGRIISVAPHNT